MKQGLVQLHLENHTYRIAKTKLKRKNKHKEQ